MSVCLRHLVKVGGSIGSNHIVFAMTASVLVINNALLVCGFVISYSMYHIPSPTLHRSSLGGGGEEEG